MFLSRFVFVLNADPSPSQSDTRHKRHANIKVIQISAVQSNRLSQI